MAKNNTKNVEGGDHADTYGGVEASDASLATPNLPKSGADEVVVGQISDGGLDSAGVSGIMLAEHEALTPAGQIAARGKMSVAYWNVYGKHAPTETLVAWSEGGYLLPAPLKVAEILQRICASLGLATIVKPAE